MASFSFKLQSHQEGQSRYSVSFDRLGSNLKRKEQTFGSDQLQIRRGRRGYVPTGVDRNVPYK